jgi:hypothetical protein
MNMLPLPDYQLLRTPAGEELVVLTRKAFDDLVNARNHVLSREDVIVDRVETLTAEETAAALAAPSHVVD